MFSAKADSDAILSLQYIIDVVNTNIIIIMSEYIIIIKISEDCQEKHI